MTKSTHRSAQHPFAVVAVACLCWSGCAEEEQIQRVNPIISVCPTREAPAEECDRPLDLGELPITLPFSFAVFVRNRGEAPLVVSAIDGMTDIASSANLPVTISAGGVLEVTLTLTPKDLGPATAEASITSDDPERSPLRLELRYTGTPKPVPKIELCVEERPEIPCGTDLVLDFGVVRRSQQESATVLVKNVGTAPLNITAVRTASLASASDEIVLATSTRPGEIAPGSSGPVVVIYEPFDGIADAVDLRFSSDDPASPEAVVRIRGAADSNAPPTAEIRRVGTGSTSTEVFVEETVALDGSASIDPEGDPLTFTWTLTAPLRSMAALDDPAAGLVTFVPDVAGTYRIDLVTFDSLGQPSEVAAQVVITARPRNALKAVLTWQTGGDVDLHLVRDPGMMFSANDCYYENPEADFGTAGDSDDNAFLRDDAVGPPGRETIVMPVPAAGTYRLYAHYFDDEGAGAAMANVEIVFDDASIPAYQSAVSLPGSCALWHVGDIEFPSASFTPASTQLGQLCR